MIVFEYKIDTGKPGRTRRRVPQTGNGVNGSMADYSGFSQGETLDMARPSAKLAGILEQAAGQDRRYRGLDDDQLTGALGRWAAVESWACSQKLAAVTELVRRRGIPALGTVTGPADIAPEVPAGWDESVSEEAALALGMSKPATDKLVSLAVTLATRLTATAAALETGDVDYVKASIMAEVTRPLDNEAAWNAEKLALMQAGGSFKGKTPGELRKLTERASIAADPEAAEKRRIESERNAKVASWREPEGTMAIQASGLNPADAMDAEAAVQERAEAYKKAGMTGGMDKLRARAFTDKLTGRNPLAGDTGTGTAAPRRVHLTAPEWILPLLTVLGLADNPGRSRRARRHRPRPGPPARRRRGRRRGPDRMASLPRERPGLGHLARMSAREPAEQPGQSGQRRDRPDHLPARPGQSVHPLPGRHLRLRPHLPHRAA